MIFRIKLHWWSSLLAAALMLATAWALGGTRNIEGRFDSTWMALAVGTGGAVVSLFANLLLDRMLRIALGARYAKQFHTYAMDVVGQMGLADALAGGLLAAVGEEPVFRGVILPLFPSPVPGVLGTALVFGLAHYLRREYFWFLVWAIGEGLLFGTLYVVTDSILVPAVAHGTFDTVGFLYFQRLRRRHALVRIGRHAEHRDR